MLVRKFKWKVKYGRHVEYFKTKASADRFAKNARSYNTKWKVRLTKKTKKHHSR